MANYLTHDEFVPYAPDELGKEIHIHHCKSGRGNDKLYIKRNQDGSIVAFCHHCTTGGRYSDKSYLSSAYSEDADSHLSLSILQGGGGSRVAPFSIPSDSEGQPSKWGSEALAWARQYLSDDEIRDSPLCWSDQKEAIVFPLISDDHPSTLVGMQLRPFPAKDVKYLTYMNKSLGNDVSITPFYIGSRSDTLVITEDWISAYKAALAGYEGVPLLGSNMQPHQFRESVRGQYKRYVVALDNDKPAIRSTQRKLYTRFSAYGDTMLLLLDKDLKTFNLEEIKERVEV